MTFPPGGGQGFPPSGFPNLVVIGTELLYSPSPGPGNLVLSIANVGGEDGYGNFYPSGLQVTDGAGNGIHLALNGQLVILGTGLSTAGFLSSIMVGSGASASPGIFLSGASNNDIVPQLFLFGESTDATNAAHALIAGYSLSGNTQAALDVDLVGVLRWAAVGTFINDVNLYRLAAGNLATDGLLTAIGGATAGDAWHSLGSPSATGYTVNQGRYRKNVAENETEIDIQLSAAVGGGTAGTYTFANLLPASYQFAGNYSRAYAFGYNATIAAGAQEGCVLMDSAGSANPGRVRIQIPGLSSGTTLGLTASVPLS